MIRILLFFLLICSLSAEAFEVPRDLPAGYSNFTYHAYLDACYSMENFLDSLPCNPAYLPRAPRREKKYYVQGFFGNNIKYARDINAVLDNTADVEAVDRILNQDRSSDLEADIEIGTFREDWAFSLSPTRLNLYSLIRNRALPFVSLYASQEQVLRIQWARELDEEFSIGLQVKGLHRRFIFSEFFLTDALVEKGSERVLEIQKQNALFLEPGVVWTPSGNSLNTKVSAAVTQLGFVDHRHEGLTTDPEGQIGFSVRPPVESGTLETGAQLSIHSQYEKGDELVRLAGSYEWDIYQVAGSLNRVRQDIGLMARFSSLRGGILLDHRDFNNTLGRSDDLRTFYFQIAGDF